MRRYLAALLFVVSIPLNVRAADNFFLGAWSFKLPDGNPAWLKITNGEDGPQGALLWSVGSAKPVQMLSLTEKSLEFSRRIKWKPYGNSTVLNVVSPFVGEMNGGQLKLTFSQAVAGEENAKPQVIVMTGKRIPAPPEKPDLTAVRFGQAIDLFNGKDLTGWRLSNTQKKNGWRAENGVLVNRTPKTDFAAYGEFGNLMTESVFTDFELTIEYNVPKGGNSGIYIRGMYEAQVVDRDSRMQGIQGPGAIFGRIKPSENAGNAGGEWNTYVITLVDRHVTVVLNGKTVIDNQLLEGCTGGGLQSDDTQPGPIFLQGDHTSVNYRNISLRPVMKR